VEYRVEGWAKEGPGMTKYNLLNLLINKPESVG
jgi:hypothetical protein